MNARAMMISIAVAAGLGLTACGGDDKGGDKLSKSELASKATAICKTSKAESSKIATPSNLGDPEAAAAYFDKISASTQKQTDALSALDPADDVKADWNAYVDKQQEATELLKQTRDKARAKDPSGLEDFQKNAGVIGQEVDTAGKKVGVESC